MPSASPPTERLESRHLIALNADLDLSRDAVCTLAGATEPWWRDRAGGSRSLAGRLGVRRGELAIATALLPRASELARSERRRAELCDAEIITWLDASYPRILLDLAQPPPVLYLRGSLPERPCLSVVGARRASPYGTDVARAFAEHLASHGLAIVSGFARGIDAAAHRGAVEAGGVTVAVLGCGLGVDYPRGRDRLREELCARGALLSEFPCDAAPLPRNFPIRNRLIAALGQGTLVIEATARSGSLITARLALELGRDIYAIPGRIHDDRALGPNALIRDGAFLVQHPKEILESLPVGVQEQLETVGPAPSALLPPADLPDDQRRILDVLPRGERLPLDDLVQRCEIPLARLSALLLELELAGWLRRHPGPSFARTG